MRLPPADITPPQWQIWDIAPGVTLDVLLGPPTFADRFSAIDAMRSRIKDWRGVEDDQGEPVRYSFEALDRVIALHPDALSQLQSLVRPDHPELEKNADSPEPSPIVERPTSTPESIPNAPPEPALLPASRPGVTDDREPLPHASNREFTPEIEPMRAVTAMPTESPSMMMPEDTVAEPAPQIPITDESMLSGSPDVSHFITKPKEDPPPPTEPVQALVTDKSARSAMPTATADSTPEFARQLQQANQATSQMRDQQQQMQQSLDEAWRVLHHLAGRGGNASQRAQLTGGGR